MQQRLRDAAVTLCACIACCKLVRDCAKKVGFEGIEYAFAVDVSILAKINGDHGLVSLVELIQRSVAMRVSGYDVEPC